MLSENSGASVEICKTTGRCPMVSKAIHIPVSSPVSMGEVNKGR